MPSYRRECTFKVHIFGTPHTLKSPNICQVNECIGLSGFLRFSCFFLQIWTITIVFTFWVDNLRHLTWWKISHYISFKWILSFLLVHGKSAIATQSRGEYSSKWVSLWDGKNYSVDGKNLTNFPLTRFEQVNLLLKCLGKNLMKYYLKKSFFSSQGRQFLMNSLHNSDLLLQKYDSIGKIFTQCFPKVWEGNKRINILCTKLGRYLHNTSKRFGKELRE